MAITLTTPVTDFPGIGPARAQKLAKLGLGQAGDLLTYYPRHYEDRRKVWTIRDAPLEGRVCVCAMVAERPRLSRIRRGLDLVQVKAVDQTGTLHLTFFNQSYMEKALSPGEEYIFYGAVEEQGRRRSMVNPIFERADRQDVTGRIVPVYPLTAGISNHLMLGLTGRALACAGQLPETLPPAIRREHSLAELEFALKNIHFPADEASLDLARRRLTFEELFYLSVGLTFLKDRRADCGPGQAMPALPFADFQNRGVQAAQHSHQVLGFDACKQRTPL